MLHLINVGNKLFLLFLVTHLNQILVSVTGEIIATGIEITTKTTTIVDNKGCVVPFSSKKYWDVFWPLIFHTNGKLYETTKIFNQDDGIYGKSSSSSSSSSSVVVVSFGDEVFISCSPNYIKEHNIPQTEYVRAICQNDGKFLVKGNSASSSSSSSTKTIHDLRCDLRAIEEVLETVSDCSIPSTSVHFGYTNPIDNLSYVIGEACYNTQKGQTRFIHIHLTGTPSSPSPPSTNKINSNLSSSTGSGSGTGSATASELRTESKRFFKKSHPQLGYKIEFMRAFRLDEFNDRLKNILNDNNDGIPSFKMENYIDENLLGNQQYYPMIKLSWNYFVIYDDISINMKLLKEDISHITDNNNIDLYVGSHGVIKLKKSITSNNVEEIPIYLKDEKFPIPEILWFIVKKDDKATVLIIFNNPKLTLNDITNNKFCPSYSNGNGSDGGSSKCNEITWLKRTGKQDVNMNLKHGAIICCNYDEFKKSVEEVPNIKGIKDLYV